MTDEQRRQIRQAAAEAYDKLRWMVGDHPRLKAELYWLAADSFLAGFEQGRAA